MGLFNSIIGNASEVNLDETRKKYGQIIGENEEIQSAYKLVRDMFIFTNKRLILIDVQGVTGKKVEYHSIPYKSITHFSIETAGNFDLDAELKIWISGAQIPIQKQFNKNCNIYEIQTILSEYVLS